MRKHIIAGNWKLNKTISEASELAGGLVRNLSGIENVDIVVCPPFTALGSVAAAIKGSNIKLGGQDLFWEDKGAFTGEISAPMLKDAGCSFVIIGHSERRQYFAETNETVNKKLRAALKAGLVPVVCVGEKLAEREGGKAFDVVRDHVANGFKDISELDMRRCIIAYEPVWAIGTGKNATPEQAQEVHGYIRGLLAKLYSKETAVSARIQYGGSVTPENIASLMEKPDLDGALVGGSSLKANSFSEIVKKTSEVKAKCISR
jgi:triosephosphate isomerase